LTGRYSWLKRLLSKGDGSGVEVTHSQTRVLGLTDSVMLGVEAQRAIGLRLAAIARGGPTAEAEARLMVTEKMNAVPQAANMVARGASTRSVISFYRSRVQANVRRLTQKPPPLRHAKQKLLDSLKAFRVMTSRYGINKI
jgi:hypothetical protein